MADRIARDHGALAVKVAVDKGHHRFLDGFARRAVRNLCGETALAVMFGVPVVHAVENFLRLLDDGMEGFEFFEMNVGDDRGDLDRDLFFNVEAGHFHVDPEQLFHREQGGLGRGQRQLKNRFKNPDMGTRAMPTKNAVSLFQFFRFNVVVALVTMAAGPAHAIISPMALPILEKARLLTVEGESEKTKSELEQTPRPQLISALKEGLADPAWRTVSLNAATALSMNELLPSIKKSLESSSDWTVYAAVEKLAKTDERASLVPILKKHLSSGSAPEKVAILSTLGKWKEPVTSQEFDKLLKDESFQVRIALARSFASSRSALALKDQTTRFDQLFSSDPYQVRLDAMFSFESMPKEDQAQLKAVIGTKFKKACEKEKKPLVLDECHKILAALPKDSK